MSQYCFPYPQDSDVPPLRVPYVATTHRYSIDGPYTFESFYNSRFPNDIQNLLRQAPASMASKYRVSKLQVRPPPASIIQAWLFFGLASEALGRDVAHDEFLEDNAIDLRMPSWFWSEFVSSWIRLRDDLPQQEYEQKVQQLNLCCTSANCFLGALDLDLARHPTDPPRYDGNSPLGVVLLSVHMLLYLISGSEIPGSPQVLRSGFGYRSTDLLIQRMTSEGGWCRKRVNVVESPGLSYPTLYFLSSVRPRRANKEYHQSCTPRSCLVRTGLVEPLHRTPGCGCRDVPVPLEPVLKIVGGGGIPLIRIRQSPPGDFRLEVVPYARMLRFAAISHVWADRQLGSTKNALPTCQVEHLASILASLPQKSGAYEGLLPTFIRSPKPSELSRNASNEWYFWLDTFCIPQKDEHSQLRNQAIGSMNLIYTEATETLGLDHALQTFDAGQQPHSLRLAGPPTFYAPADENLLDVTAQICASNWMGRSWTLQEGVLSWGLVFSLKGSFAFLRMLTPTAHDQLLFLPIDHWERKGKELMWIRVNDEMLSFTKASLNVDEHSIYARGSGDRSARFINAHCRLQSRTTTMTEDLPLILMNMSGMNGNLIAQAKGVEQKMKLLVYSLGTVPAEMLFSDCKRLGSGGPDSWIPVEVVAETFFEDHFLRLDAEGFGFHSKDSNMPLKFYFVSRAAVWRAKREAILTVFDGPEDEERRFAAKAISASSGPQPTTSASNDWCILIEHDSTNPRAARFKIVRRTGNNVFLQFDCTMRLSLIANDTDTSKPGKRKKKQKNMPSYIARPADSSHKFIIPRSQDAIKSLSMARPQNPTQYSDRLLFIHGHLYWALGHLEGRILERFFGDFDAVIGEHFLTIGIPYWFYNLKKFGWIEDGLNALVHRAWVATYSPTWDPNGPWKWFWKAFNFEPAVPLSDINKFYMHLVIFRLVYSGSYAALGKVAMFWVAAYPIEELVGTLVCAFPMTFIIKLFW